MKRKQMKEKRIETKKENHTEAVKEIRRSAAIEEGSADSFDEKNMIMEQNRLLKEKKRKRNRKKRRITGGILLLCAAGGIWYLVWGKKLAQTSEGSAVRVTASPGQEIVYARLDSVNGNEITYTVAEETEQTQAEQTRPEKNQTEQTRAEQTQTEQTRTEQTRPEQTRTEQTRTEKGTEDSSYPPENNGRNISRNGDGEVQQGQKVTEDEETGEGQSGTLAAPDGHGQEASGVQDSSAQQKVSHIQDTFYSTELQEMPDMTGMGDMTGSEDNGGMPAGPEAGGFMGTGTRGEMSGIQGNSGAFTYNSTVYQLTEETEQNMIPVGTPVTTRLGTVTTFSRLAAGDYVALVMEEDGGGGVITAVYIVG